MISASFRFLCFLWRKGGWRRGFKKQNPLLLSSWVLLFAWPSGTFVSLVKSPVIFSKASVYNNPSCGSAHPAHFTGVNVKKTKCCWVWVCFKMLLFSLQIFHEQGLYSVAKEWMCWPFWSPVWFGGLGWGKRMTWVFLTSFTCEYCCFFRYYL